MCCYLKVLALQKYIIYKSEDVLNALKSIKWGINYKKLKNYYLIKGFGGGYKTQEK